ncbi:MAG: carbohydrate-binding family 9-like protein [Bryobacteraceae bacterium]
MKTVLALAAAAALVFAAEPGVIVSRYAKADFALAPDPDAPQWKGVPGVFAANGPDGKPVPGHRTEIRSRWTDKNIYFLFICPYETLHLKPNPEIKAETNYLWEYDVAEVFAGWDANNINSYKEFEISPRGEWVDLDITRTPEKLLNNWQWNSGFENQARIDAAAKIWYGVMKIPLKSIDPRPPANGRTLRVNLYRCQGAAPDRKYIAWQPTRSRTFHVPQSFGTLRLEGK